MLWPCLAHTPDFISMYIDLLIFTLSLITRIKFSLSYSVFFPVEYGGLVYKDQLEIFIKYKPGCMPLYLIHF